jgi:hypothetical protein
VKIDETSSHRFCYIKESDEPGLFLLVPTEQGIRDTAYVKSVFDVERMANGINVVLYPAVIRQMDVGYVLQQKGKFIKK